MERAAHHQLVPSVAVSGRRIVVVGGGPVGMHFARELSGLAPDCWITVLGDEPSRPYDRLRLSAFVARELRHEALYETRHTANDARLEVRCGVRVVAVERDRKRVLDRSGFDYAYDQLVLATGSRPRVPPIPGRELGAVYVFRNLADAHALLARQMRSRCTVVVGGGLLGLEAARAMRRFHTRVHVVEHEPRLMFQQLDAKASDRLRTHVERLGIRVHTGDSIQQIIGCYSPAAVRLRSGAEIACDTVVIAAGIDPNIELAREAGIAVGRGIRVDDRLRTSDPDVYAIGECCEHRDRVYGLVGPGIEQAAVVAHGIAGHDACYTGSIASSSLKVVGCPVFSMGDVVDSVRSYTTHTFENDRTYRRINIFRGRVIGAVGIGDWDVARLRQLGFESRRLWPWQLWRFKASGRLWRESSGRSIAAWPATSKVCACRNVTRGALSAAIEQGAATVEALAEATGASTVCGSCRPLLGDLLGAPRATPRIPRTLLAASVAATLLAALAFTISLPYAPTATTPSSWDRLWTESLLRQTSGFTLLGLAVLVSSFSLRKRVERFGWGSLASWQLAHVIIGGASVAALLAHTGFRFGSNLNFWLMLSFTGVLFAGGLTGVSTALGGRMSASCAQRLRATGRWLHILLIWPLPALLGFHVLQGYYF